MAMTGDFPVNNTLGYVAPQNNLAPSNGLDQGSNYWPIQRPCPTCHRCPTCGSYGWPNTWTSPTITWGSGTQIQNPNTTWTMTSSVTAGSGTLNGTAVTGAEFAEGCSHDD